MNAAKMLKLAEEILSGKISSDDISDSLTSEKIDALADELGRVGNEKLSGANLVRS